MIDYTSNVRPESMERITTKALAEAFISEQIAEIQAQVGNKKVLLALSGGVDSGIIAGVTASLYVVIASMIFQNGRVVLSGALRGAGDVKYVAVCALLSVTILRPILTYLFCYPVAGLLPGIPHVAVMAPWIAFLIDSIVRDRLLSHRIRQGKWLDIKLE